MGSHVPSLPLPSLKAKMTDEWRLVRAVQIDAPGAFREFVEFYQNPIYSLVLSLLGDPATADNVAQNVFIEAHRSIRQFKSHESALVRLFQIAVRMATANAERNTPGKPDLARARAIELLRKAPDNERVLLMLRDVQGYSVPELSGLFRMQEGFVRASLLKARRRLVRAMRTETR